MPQLKKSPSAKNAIFIIDASHAVEEQLLKDWLLDENLGALYDHSESVVIPIAANPDSIEHRRLSPLLHKLPENREETDLIPVRVVWKTSLDQPHSRPRLRDLMAGNQRRPGRLHAQRIIKRNPEQARCFAATPATYAKLSDDHRLRVQHHAGDESLEEYICHQATLALDVAERQFRGSRYRVPRRIVSNLLADPDFRAELKALAEKQNTTVSALLEEANPIFKELIAKPVNFWQDTMAAVQRLIVTRGYDHDLVVDRERLKQFKQLASEKPTALLWTHKTHVDGFAVATLFFEEDFPATHTLGGVNMAFAGLGFLARNSSGIFIRRSFSDDQLYKLILRHYLGFLLKKRFPLSWAFEGTRSRVGKLMPPRFGILKYVVESAQSLNLDDLQIVPVAINYDLINDVRDYVAEQHGAVKTPESLRWFINYLRRFKSSHGKIYIDFGEPVSVSTDAKANSSLDIAKIAFEVGVEANRVSPITLTSLVVFILLGITPKAITEEQLAAQITQIIEWGKIRGLFFTEELNVADIQKHIDLDAVMINSGLVSRYDQGPDAVYVIRDDQQGIAGYYRNTIVHHFVLKSIAELALLKFTGTPHVDIDKFWEQIDEMRDLFKFEFFYTPSDTFRGQVDDELKQYDPNWQHNLANTEDYATSFLIKLSPHFSHSALLPFIEAYSIVAGIFARLPANETIESKACVAQALRFGQQALLQNRIRSQASIGKLLFENGYKLLESRGLVAASSLPANSIDEDSNPTTIARKQFSREMWSLADRVSTIRALVSPSNFDF